MTDVATTTPTLTTTATTEKAEEGQVSGPAPPTSTPAAVAAPSVTPESPTTSEGHHALRHQWTLWFMHRTPGQKITDYEAAIKRIATFGTIEEFWHVHQHLVRPNDLPNISDYHLFKAGVRPVWEDDANIKGGKWIVRLKKGLASRYWESLMIAVVGDQFDLGDEICGAVLSMRNSEDILSLWNRTASGARVNLRIRDTLKRILGAPADTVMEYKAHTDALRDNSSFRNTDVYK